MELGQKLEKKYTASLEHLYPMLKFIKSYARNMGFEGVPLSRIELASEEALVNIINYAYPETEDGEIQIELLGLGKKELRIRIIDQGIPFNPLSNSRKFEVKALTTNHTIGGYGTFFIIQLMDRVEYERDNGSNCLTLIKSLLADGRLTPPSP